MKKYRKTGAALLAAALLCAGGAVQAELAVNSVDDLNGDGWAQHDGIWAPTQDISDNVVTIGSDGTSPDLSGKYKYISGGYSDKDVVSGNSVTMKSGTVGALYGGWSKNGSAESNTVNFSGDTVNYVYGGRSENGSVESNTVTISGGQVGQDVNGGFSPGGSAESNTVTISGGNVGGTVFGGNSGYEGAERNTVTVFGGKVGQDVYGGFSSGGSAESNMVTISGKAVVRDVYGGYSEGRSASDNTVTLSGGTVKGKVYGGYSENGSATDNTVTLTGTANAEGANLYGSNKEVSEDNSGNNLVVDNWSGSVDGLHNFESIRFTNIALDGTTELKIGEKGTVTGMGDVDGNLKIYLDSLAAGDYAGDQTLSANVKWDNRLGTDVTIADDLKNNAKGWFSTDCEDGGLYVTQFSNIDVTQNTANKNQVNISATVKNSVFTGKFIDEDGTAHVNSTYAASLKEGQKDTPQSLVIDNKFSLQNIKTVAGVYDVSAGENIKGATGGQVLVTGEVNYNGTVYAGYSENGAAMDNTVYVGWDGSTVKAAHASGLSVSGANKVGSNNMLHVYGNGNTLGSIGQFNTLAFDDVELYGAGTTGTAALSVTDADLTGASVSLNSLKGGTDYQAGDHVTLLQSTNDMTGADSASVKYSGNVTAGVAQDLQIETEQTATSIGMTVKSVSLAPQTLTIAENRTAAAAFLNQGADIAADSLDLLGSDYKYGLRTFGAVYGSRSTYDAAGDLKINGWSEIVGLGNVHRKGDGDLSWGVFYENGTGNYRTWNEFNNEMFRGDGSLLYNGGGAAVRYQKDDGWYYEASVRAGTLSASMDNAVKDGKGQSYGFDSDSTYWGAHAGAGKVIENDRGEWNVYGKYFHTDIDGDSFNIAGDAFTFDSLTSDRLRLGARYTADKAKQWSLYYGLAW